MRESLAPAVPSEATFSSHALRRMMYLFKHHENEVGSLIKGVHPDLKPTDCITYVINVLSYAFDQLGDKASAMTVRGLGNAGTDLARYLVDSHNWIGVYINKDVARPYDLQDEHPFAYSRAKSLGTYYQIPVRYLVVNYDPTTACNVPSKLCSTQFMGPFDDASISTMTPVRSRTRNNSGDYSTLEKLPFAMGLSRGGMHCWLFSAGDVYEVHWGNIGDDLYAKTPLREFIWADGAIVVPPDEGMLLTGLSSTK